MPVDKDLGGRFGRLGRRLMGEEGEGARPFRFEAKELFNSVLEGGEKARTEVVKIFAREARTYFEELGLKDDLRHLMTNYSFDIKASINLRKLTEAEKGTADVEPVAEAETGASASVEPEL